MTEKATKAKTTRKTSKKAAEPVQENQTVTEQAESAQAQALPDLQLADLTNMLKIVDVAAQRGAFRAEEMEDVGKAYRRVKAFVEAANAAKQENTVVEGE